MEIYTSMVLLAGLRNLINISYKYTPFILPISLTHERTSFGHTASASRGWWNVSILWFLALINFPCSFLTMLISKHTPYSCVTRLHEHSCIRIEFHTSLLGWVSSSCTYSVHNHLFVMSKLLYFHSYSIFLAIACTPNSEILILSQTDLFSRFKRFKQIITIKADFSREQIVLKWWINFTTFPAYPLDVTSVNPTACQTDLAIGQSNNTTCWKLVMLKY